MSSAEYRIDYSILRRQPGETEFTEIGFGTSGTHPSIAAAAFAVDSDIQNKQWETDPGMPDPADAEPGGADD